MFFFSPDVVLDSVRKEIGICCWSSERLRPPAKRSGFLPQSDLTIWVPGTGAVAVNGKYGASL